MAGSEEVVQIGHSPDLRRILLPKESFKSGVVRPHHFTVVVDGLGPACIARRQPGFGVNVHRDGCRRLPEHGADGALIFIGGVLIGSPAHDISGPVHPQPLAEADAVPGRHGEFHQSGIPSRGGGDIVRTGSVECQTRDRDGARDVVRAYTRRCIDVECRGVVPLGTVRGVEPGEDLGRAVPLKADFGCPAAIVQEFANPNNEEGALVVDRPCVARTLIGEIAKVVPTL